MESKHAILSASASSRWIACPPSALLCAKEKEEVSSYALEGTSAHTLCEYYLRCCLQQNPENPIENLEYYNEEMDESAREYAIYVLEQFLKIKEECKDALILIEQKLDFSNWVPEGFGTGDALIIADKKLIIVDFKYGKGILVKAERNTQMMCYALGALSTFDYLYDIDEIEMIIFQPRKENISSYSMSKSELLEWANSTLKEKAELAIKGEGEFSAGGHCQFCKVKNNCRKRAEENLKLAKYDFHQPPILEDVEIEVILAQVDELVAWANDIKEYALKQAIKGKKWQDYKLVEGRSVRKYIDESKVADIVKSNGFNPYEEKVLGITAMTKLLGKAKFEELITPLLYKESGKPTLVLRSDKRKEIDFKEEK